jgi:hypothetical protein
LLRACYNKNDENCNETGERMKWMSPINFISHIRRVRIKRRIQKFLTCAEFSKNIIVTELLRENVHSLENEGWCDEAIYLGFLRNLKSVQPDQLPDFIENNFEEAHIIGSKVFMNMLSNTNSKLRRNAKQTLIMFHTILGATVDSNNFLQLQNVNLRMEQSDKKYSFSKDMLESIHFDAVYSQLVQKAYPKGLPTDVPRDSTDFILCQQIHQFRYFLDKQNNEALRSTYPNAKNDLERIKQFNKEHPNSLLGEKARLHNKYPKNVSDYSNFTREHGENIKIVSFPNFHSEWIINEKTGNLVSQWNAYSIDEDGHIVSNPNQPLTMKQEYEIMNGNSVNFANNSSDRFGRAHYNFDSKPVSVYDPDIRKSVGKRWKSPELKQWLENGEENPNFFNRKISVEKANHHLTL